MTLQQLKYVVTVAETGTITEAANRLYISQPSLTNAIRELEKEMKITIFLRTNKGIILSKEGEDFLGYARQVLEQAAILEDKYKGTSGEKKKFCVSTQHYSFAVNAFVDLIKTYGQDEYDFSLRETQTYEIIEDVAKMRSEIGILFLNNFNETVLHPAPCDFCINFLNLRSDFFVKLVTELFGSLLPYPGILVCVCFKLGAVDVEMLQIYMLIVKDSMIDVVKNVFNLILKYFIDEISKGSV